MIISDVTGFILSRLGEDEQDARLFHELTCPAAQQQAGDGFPVAWCHCPVPAQTLVRVQATRAIITDCERQLREPGGGMPGLLPAADRIPKILGALSLAYQQHPRWKEQWRP